MESRAEMEAARLARLHAKRARDQVIDLTTSPPPVDRKLPRTAPSLLAYRDGHIGLTPTRASSVSITGSILSIEDLLSSPDTMKTVIFSSFVVDVEWVLNYITNRHACLYLVKHWSRTEREKPGRHPSIFPNLTYIHPVIRTGFGCVHPKIMVIFHERSRTDRYVRVVISSGNLIQVDYEIMENLVFVQDFPLISCPDESPLSEAAISFRNDLKEYLGQLSVPAEEISKLDLYDFKFATVRIVASVPGQHQDKFGLHSLQRAIRKSGMNLSDSEYRSNELHLECQCSSLGALNRSWLNDFYYSASAPDSARTARSTLPPIEVAFPCHDTVTGSLAGQLGGGSSIRFSPKHWHASTFPRDILRDCVSVRTGALMHSKIIIGRLPASRSLAVGDPIGWIYFGSHNFTRAAWGGFAKSGAHLTINNYEIGVLLPVRKVHVATGYRLDGKSVDLDSDQVWEQSLKKCPVPIPFMRPMPLYNGRTPWFQTGQSTSSD